MKSIMSATEQSDAVRARRWCFTLNNYTEEEYDNISNLDVKYMVVGKEIGENQTPHLQGFVCWHTIKSFEQMKKIIPRAHWEKSLGSFEQADEYCKKDNNFKTWGTPLQQGKRNDLNKAIDMLKDNKRFKEVIEQCPNAYVRFGRGLRDLNHALQKPYEHHDCRGLWIHGAPGKGKSRYARTFQDVFSKSQNKWWDGYDNQSVVVLDDFDMGGKVLGHHLKIWADRYSCTGETKGGTVNLSHKLFIITSNYKMGDIWNEHDLTEQPMLYAMRRRFIVLNFDWFPYQPEYPESRTHEDILYNAVYQCDPNIEQTAIPLYQHPIIN